MLEVDEVKRHAMVWQICDIHINEGPFLIGCVANIPRVIVVSNKLENVPQKEDLATGGFVTPWIMVYPGITLPETYLLQEGVAAGGCFGSRGNPLVGVSAAAMAAAGTPTSELSTHFPRFVGRRGQGVRGL